MTLTPDNFILFYLILGLFALAIAIVYHAGTSDRDQKSKKHNR